ncbi:MAG: DUF1365 domain-containing protein [Spirochaetales bacterium]|nr:DUF1365 domain-containing protein [Spirochaetales bacterium]
MQSCRYEGLVFHTRKIEPVRRFSYRLDLMAIDLDELHLLEGAGIRLNRPGLYSFYESDYASFAPVPGLDLKARVLHFLTGQGIQGIVDGRLRIVLVAQIRALGAAFNPVCFFYIYIGSTLVALIAEVHNTFGDKRSYVIKLNPPLKPEPAGQSAVESAMVPKILHVSPFLPAEVDFRFRISLPGDYFRISISTLSGERPLLVAGFAAARRPLWVRGMRHILRAPFLSFKTILAIHLQAAVLWIRGARFYSKDLVDRLLHNRTGDALERGFWVHAKRQQ